MIRLVELKQEVVMFNRYHHCNFLIICKQVPNGVVSELRERQKALKLACKNIFLFVFLIVASSFIAML